jgi:ABC-type nickel/cobalt efflux system permease component RcnA
MNLELAKPFTLLAILFFAAWGALHATGPGHGKTMVAAYLLGTKGRVWDAVRLGLIVTFTHTFVVYTLGLGIVFVVDRMRVSGDAVLQRSTFLITFISGIGLWLFGLSLAWARSKKAPAPEHGHAHDHGHDHAHAPLPEKLEAPKTGKRLGLVVAAPVEVAAAAHAHGEHTHADGTTHTHSHGEHTHADGTTHSHDHGSMSEAEHAAHHAREAATQITGIRDLLKLGVAGGIVPCPAAILLIVSSIATATPPLKTFVYLNAFSLGLGSVLVAIATAMVFSRKFLDRALSGDRKKALELLPIVSAVLISFVGLGVAYSAFDPNYQKAREKLSSRFTSKP